MSESIRCRIISFRVSDHEYEEVEEASRKHGFIGVSVFARSATLARNSAEPIHSSVDVEINRLWRRIEAITTALEELVARWP
jgi:hypothetical protein